MRVEGSLCGRKEAYKSGLSDRDLSTQFTYAGLSEFMKDKKLEHSNVSDTEPHGTNTHRVLAWPWVPGNTIAQMAAWGRDELMSVHGSLD